MQPWKAWLGRAPILLWVAAIAAIPLWIAAFPGLTCDTNLYLKAVHSVQAGHDPYVDGIAGVKGFARALALDPNTPIPYPYAYSPITLPLLRLIGSVPPILYIWGYWLLYAVAALTPIWVGMKKTEPEEIKFFAFLAPAVLFFPGLTQESISMSGNVACILYGLVFGAAFIGWRRGRWRWYYLAVLVASCFKAPMLSLLVLPILSARKQWLASCATGAAGIALFSIQMWVWPVYFQNYLQVLKLVFSFFQNFGVGPAGILGQILFNAGVPYSAASTVFYLVFALILLALLLYLSEQYFKGRLSLTQWIPVMFTGVILLNPRIQEYDFAPVTFFMALMLWRATRSLTSRNKALAFCALIFVVANIAVLLIAPYDPTYFGLHCIEGILLLGIFAAGYWNLVRQAHAYILPNFAPIDELPILGAGELQMPMMEPEL